jgi:hypothetical protein
MFGFTGCSGSVNAAILFLSNGDAFRDYSAGLLWSAWKLDCLSDQCSLRRVPKQKRERECQLQEPCYSGKPCEKAHNFMELKFLNFSIQKLIYIYIFLFSESLDSGLKCWMVYWVRTGKLPAWPSTVPSFSLDLLSSL